MTYYVSSGTLNLTKPKPKLTSRLSLLKCEPFKKKASDKGSVKMTLPYLPLLTEDVWQTSIVAFLLTTKLYFKYVKKYHTILTEHSLEY